MKTLLSLLGFALVAIVVARFIPVDSEPFHEDPAEPDAQRSEVRLIGREAPRFPADADTVLETFRDIATSDWSVGLVEGSVDEGMMTFVARSLVFGFRDYITVKATDEAGGAKLSVFARPRFNVYDWGVNQKRLDRWLGELDQTLRR
jgi:hypothetical protein